MPGVATVGIVVGLAALTVLADAEQALAPSVRAQRFDRDPEWEGFNNHIVPVRAQTIVQDFGYSTTQFSGTAAGEIGGQVWRATTPAYYAARIPARTLRDKLVASGTFAVTKSSSGSGVFFGWFNARQPGGGRPINSLGWYLDGENSGYWLYFATLNSRNKAQGEFVTRHRGPRVPHDGKRHTWALAYNPAANGGHGAMSFSYDGGPTITADLPAGFNEEGATFDRFGMMNVHKGGGPMTVYVDDLKYDGKTVGFTDDPHWEGFGNRVSFQDREETGAHWFGFSETNLAGKARGELGGIFWRTEEPFAYYADRVDRLTLNDPLAASGTVAFTVGGPDSAMRIGWFNSGASHEPAGQEPPSNFVGILIEGPSRIGHYFRPAYGLAQGAGTAAQQGPMIFPSDRKHSWTLTYDPRANGGNGAIRVTLDDAPVTLILAPGHKAQGASFDRFGVFTVRTGGGQVKAYFDDLSYTVARSSR